MDPTETKLQLKVIELEKNLLDIPKLNVRAQVKANNDKINMRTSKRITNTDGFYMVTVDGGISDCHAIFIYRKTQVGGKTKFYVYDPNGRNSASKYDYQTNILFDGPFEVDFSMSPKKSINARGRCAIWCIVVIILLNSYTPTDLNSFNTQMIISPDKSNTFIDEISRLLLGYKDITVSKTNLFVNEVKKQIESVLTPIRAERTKPVSSRSSSSRGSSRGGSRSSRSSRSSHRSNNNRRSRSRK